MPTIRLPRARNRSGFCSGQDKKQGGKKPPWRADGDRSALSAGGSGLRLMRLVHHVVHRLLVVRGRRGRCGRAGAVRGVRRSRHSGDRHHGDDGDGKHKSAESDHGWTPEGQALRAGLRDSGRGSAPNRAEPKPVVAESGKPFPSSNVIVSSGVSYKAQRPQLAPKHRRKLGFAWRRRGNEQVGRRVLGRQIAPALERLGRAADQG